jgi:hypothetical protein
MKPFSSDKMLQFNLPKSGDETPLLSIIPDFTTGKYTYEYHNYHYPFFPFITIIIGDDTPISL